MLGIGDPVELHQFEFEATFTRQVELDGRRLPGRYDLAHLCAFHRQLFQDVYDWAGEIRTGRHIEEPLNVRRSRFITDAADDLFGRLAAERRFG